MSIGWGLCMLNLGASSIDYSEFSQSKYAYRCIVEVTDVFKGKKNPNCLRKDKWIPLILYIAESQALLISDWKWSQVNSAVLRRSTTLRDDGWNTFLAEREAEVTNQLCLKRLIRCLCIQPEKPDVENVAFWFPVHAKFVANYIHWRAKDGEYM